MGQVVNLRPIVNRPGAGPGKLLRHLPLRRSLGSSRCNGRSAETRFRPGPRDHCSRPARKAGRRGAQDPVALSGSDSLERLHQEVHVITHDDITVEIVMAKVALVIVNSVHYHSCNLRLAKVQRASTGVVEKAIHCQEGLTGCSRRRKAAAGREAIVQPRSEEHRLANRGIMRQPASVKGHQATQSGRVRQISPAD